MRGFFASLRMTQVASVRMRRRVDGSDSGAGGKLLLDKRQTFV